MEEPAFINFIYFIQSGFNLLTIRHRTVRKHLSTASNIFKATSFNLIWFCERIGKFPVLQFLFIYHRFSNNTGGREASKMEAVVW